MRCGKIQTGENSFENILYFSGESLFPKEHHSISMENYNFPKTHDVICIEKQRAYTRKLGRAPGSWRTCIPKVLEFMFLRWFDVSEVPG